MAKEKTYVDELKKLKEYLYSESNEDAKRPLIFPLFKKLYPDRFKTESDANGADGYVEGQILIECKTSYSQWVEGFFQALHYNKRHGLVYSTVMCKQELQMQKNGK